MMTVPCAQCGANESLIVRTSPDFDFFPGETFTYVRCAACGLVYLSPRPEANEIGRFYPNDYYVTPPDTLFDFARFNRARYISRFQSPGTILDIGSNRGFFLKEMADAGWDAHGCELSAFACDYARNTLGLKNITCGDFTRAPYPDNFFDAITIWNVIEHLPDPVAALRKASSLLKKNGMIYVDTQNYASPLSTIFAHNWYQLDAPRHFYQFTPDTLKRALGGAGFTPLALHGCEPFITMVSLKVSLRRLLGRSRAVEKRTAGHGQGTFTAPSRTPLWVMARTVFDFSLLGLSSLLVLFGLGDTMLVRARKK